MSDLEIYTNSKDHRQYVRTTQKEPFIPEEHALYHISYETKKGKLYLAKVNGKVGLVNRKGRIIVPIKYHYIDRVFDNCFSGIEDADQKGYALIKFDGTRITDFVWKHIFPAKDKDNNLVIVEDYDFKSGYLNIHTGEIIVPVEYARLMPFENGMASVSTDYVHWGSVNEKGKQIVEPTYLDPIKFDGDFAIATRYDLSQRSFLPVYVVLSKTGAEVAKNSYGKINKVAENAFEAVAEIKRYGFAETEHLFFLKAGDNCTLVKEERKRSMSPRKEALLLSFETDRYIINSKGVKLSNKEITARVKQELG